MLSNPSSKRNYRKNSKTDTVIVNLCHPNPASKKEEQKIEEEFSEIREFKGIGYMVVFPTSGTMEKSTSHLSILTNDRILKILILRD